ncbi:MAG: cytochrome c biogenesis protein ResB [Mobilicoccus sp.]|nr:cytochrome c biogenesis protein ResB [Mobilicoccus sp.]
MSATTPTLDSKDERGEELRGPSLGARGWARFVWRQLTSMRTALMLLLLVAVAAIPGSVWPQRSIDAGAVATYIEENPTTGPILDTLQMFDVYTSVWFSAAYLLLLISLIGCIVPRTWRYWATLTAPPPAVPRRPERLGASLTLAVPLTPADTEERVRRALKRRRYRLRGPEKTGEVAAETGYLREFGNICFHYGIVVVTVALAAGYLVGWKADRIVPIGESFANTRAAYHTFTGGPLVDDTDLQPFVVTLDSMSVRFEDRVGTGQLGAPRDFRIETTIRDTPTSEPRHDVLAVNDPLHFRGAEVYLLGNGYAPVITVRDAAGEVIYSQATPFLPHDDNYRSTGAIKVPAAAPEHLGFAGVFVPTAVEVGDQGQATDVPGDTMGDLQSGFPDLHDPLLVLTVHTGQLFPDASPQSVYELDTSGMTDVVGADGAPLRLQMRPGDVVDLPNGLGSVEFEQVDRWAGISTRYDPVKNVALWSSIVMLLGLLASLVIPRRRVFARAVADDEGGSRLLLAGLAQREDTRLGELLESLADDLAEAVPGTTIIEKTERTDRS